MFGKAALPARLYNLQILRAFAALSVVIHHIAWDVQVLKERHGISIAIQRIFPFDSGVDLFFVISGFIMAWTMWDQFGLPGASLSFLRRRLIRVVPLYWATTTLLTLIILLVPSNVSMAPPTPTQFVLSLIFMPYSPSPGGASPVFPLGWTLNYEMLFYVLFAVAVLAPISVGLLLLGVTFLFLIVLNMVWTLPEPFSFWGNPIILEFLMGVVLSLPMRAGVRIGPIVGAMLAVVGVALLAAAPRAAEGVFKLRVIAYGLPALAVVAAFVLSDGQTKFMPFSAMARLGDASYSLYLLHLLVLRVVLRIVTAFALSPTFEIACYVVAAITLSIAFAIATHDWFERPLMRLSGLRSG